MAKFKRNNLELKTNQKIFLGNSHEVEIRYDGTDLLLDSSVRITDHVAIGNQAIVDQYGLKVLGINENFTTGSGGWGISVNINSDVDNGAAWTGGILGYVQTPTLLHNTVQGGFFFANCTGDGVTVTDIIGAKGAASCPADNSTITNHIGLWGAAGTGFSMLNQSITNLIAIRAQALDAGSGDVSITNAYGVLVESPGYTPSGTITNLYGLHIQDQSNAGFTNHFNIYSAGANSKNYFEGEVEIDGAFTSVGIDDNCTSEKFQISDSGIVLGGTSTSFPVVRGTDSGYMTITGGINTSLGAILTLFGRTSVNPSNFSLRSEAQDIILWDNSTGILTLGNSGGNPVLTVDSTSIIVTGDIHCDDLYTSGDTIHVGTGEIKSTAGNVELNYAGNKVVETTAWGAYIYNPSDVTDYLQISVDDAIVFGNDTQGGGILLRGEKTGGGNSYLFIGNPDGGAQLFYNGGLAFETNAGGALIYDPTGSVFLQFAPDATQHLINSDAQAATIKIQGEATGGGNITLAVFDPDGAVDLYYAGNKVFETDSTGIIVTGDVTATTYHGDGSQLSGIAHTTPAGNNNEVQYNNNGEFGASQHFTFTGSAIQIGTSGIQISAYGDIGRANNDIYVIGGSTGNPTGQSHLHLQNDGGAILRGSEPAFGDFHGGDVTLHAGDGSGVGVGGDVILDAGLGSTNGSVLVKVGGNTVGDFSLDQVSVIADDSYVKVVDDGTASGYIEIVADAVQVAYFDAEAASIRLGKASGAGRVVISDTEVDAFVGSTQVLDLTATTQKFGKDGDTWINIQQSGTIIMYDNNVGWLYSGAGDATYYGYDVGSGGGWNHHLSISNVAAPLLKYTINTPTGNSSGDQLEINANEGTFGDTAGPVFNYSSTNKRAYIGAISNQYRLEVTNPATAANGTVSIDDSGNNERFLVDSSGLYLKNLSGNTELIVDDNGVSLGTLVPLDSTAGIVVAGDLYCDDLFTSGNTIHLGSNTLLKSPAGTDFAVEINGVEYMNLEAGVQTFGVSGDTYFYMSELVNVLYGYAGNQLYLGISHTSQAASLGNLTKTNILLDSANNIATIETNNATAFRATTTSVELYYSGGKVFQTISGGIMIGSSSVGFNLNYVGNDIYLSNDIQDGLLTIRGTNSSDLSSNIITADPNAGVALYYDGVKVFETDTTGIIVTGDIYCDDLYASASTIHVGTGEIKSTAGNVELHYGGAKKIETDSGGVQIAGDAQLNAGDVNLDQGQSVGFYISGAYRPCLTVAANQLTGGFFGIQSIWEGSGHKFNISGGTEVQITNSGLHIEDFNKIILNANAEIEAFDSGGSTLRDVTGRDMTTEHVYLGDVLEDTEIRALSSIVGNIGGVEILSLESTGLNIVGDVNADAFVGDGSQLTNLPSIAPAWIEVDTDYTASAGDNLLVDTDSTGAVIITLPASPSIGDEIEIVDAAINFGTNNCTIARNGENIDGNAGDYVLNSDKADVRLVYASASTGWRVLT